MGIQMRKRMSLALKVLVGIIYTLPIVLCLIYSVHPNSDFAKGNLNLFPDELTFENFVYVIENVPTLRYFKNTFIMVIICVPCQMLLNTMAAYAFSYYNFPFRNLLFSIFLTSMMIPGEVIIISNYITIQKMGLMNTYLGMTITSLAGAGGIFMLRQHMMSLPKELWEASKIDGCGKLKYMVKVIFPLSKTIISALSITSFIGIYGAYLWPLLVTTDDKYHTIQIGMSALMAGTGTRYGIVLAGAAVSMLLPVIIFIVGQDRIVEGMTAGAVKS